MSEKQEITKAQFKKMVDGLYPNSDTDRKIRTVFHVMENYGRADISDPDIKWITEAISGVPYEEYKPKSPLHLLNFQEEE